MPSSTTTATSTSQTLQLLQSQAAQKAQAIGQNVFTAYFSNLTILDAISFIICLGIVAAIVYFIIETGWFTLRVERFRDIILRSNISKKHAQESWHSVQQNFFRGGDNDLKVAIIEADKLLNEALRDAGIMGSHLGDRLKKADAKEIPNINELWQAHKLRNQIAHESNFKVKRDLAERALNIYEEALKNLGVFDAEETTITKSR